MLRRYGEEAKYVIKIPLRLEHDVHEERGDARAGSETNKVLCLTQGGVAREVQVRFIRGREEKFAAPRDKINDDECFKRELFISMNATHRFLWESGREAS